MDTNSIELPWNKRFDSKKRVLYTAMRSRIIYDEKYKHVKLLVTWEEFLDWLKTQPYTKLYKSWVKSGFKHSLSPSVDRLDSKGSYSLDNMELVTSGENTRRSVLGKIGHKPGVAVKGVNAEGKVILSRTILGAAKALNIHHANIRKALNGDYKTSGGYKWTFQ